MTDLLNRMIGFDVETVVQWRYLDGTPLMSCYLNPTGSVRLLLRDVAVPYDLYARADGADWRLIYEVRMPDGGMTVARIGD